jgi:hypothetical protein
MKVYKITEKRLIELLDYEGKCIGLENAGVDNWCGYDEVDWEEIEKVSLGILNTFVEVKEETNDK